MRASTFWKAITVDEAGLLERLVHALEERGVRYCLIGGQAVNAYVEPLVSLDLDIVIAADQMPVIDSLTAALGLHVERFPHSLNLGAPGSDLRVQVQLDPRYGPFLDRSTPRTVLGFTLPVASLDDVLRGKVWAVSDSSRRASKRQKDLADIARIIEAYPALRSQVPAEILTRLV